MVMIDAILIAALKRGSENALGRVIDKYNAYVCAIIRNTVSMPQEDVEETASDVFLSLWKNADRVQTLKPWLGSVARNKARNKTRKLHNDLPFDEEILSGGSANGFPSANNDLDDALIADNERDMVNSAILAMNSPDREIFMRHYYSEQTTAAIGEEIGLSEAAVKMRLKRGRERLRIILNREVY